MHPKISVVIPVYNRANSVLPTLQSVQNQTFSDFECIVVDDGSKDGEELRKVVEGLKDARFRYVYRENGGGGAARNTGIDEAKAPIVAFLDSDDLWLPTKLEVKSALLGASQEKVIYCAAYVDRGVGRRWIRPSRGLADGEDVADYLFVSNEFIQSSSIALATAVARAVRWDPELRKGQDLDFVLRLQNAGLRFEYYAEPLVVWRDTTEDIRTSRVAGTSHAIGFLNKHSGTLSPKAIRGFRVSYLAYDLAKEAPIRALWDFALGALGGIPPSVLGRQFLRAFLPRSAYRKLVNRFVAVAGKRNE